MTRAGGRPRAPVGDAAFARLRDLLVARTGHHYYADKDEALWERVARRLRERRLDGAGAYLDLLLDPVRGEAEWRALEAEITIGETFFFRYAEQFAALRRTILPDLLRRNAQARRLRVWSAGCATGAEPYSVAVLLHDLLGEALPDWRVGILGTDLNEGFLDAARAAVFGDWALRGMPPEERERLFEPVPGARAWRLRPRYRALVRFERHNLLSLLDGTSPLQMTGFDLILCRNVLIYFHPERAQRIVGALGARLGPGGWLLLGHAEGDPAFADELRRVALPGTAAYRPRAAEEAEAAPEAPLPEPQPAPGASRDPLTEGWRPLLPPPGPVAPRPQPPAPSSPPAVPAGEAVAEDWTAAARQAFARGARDEAARLCAAALAARPDDPRPRFHAALLARDEGRHDEAEARFREALYLDKSFAMAHFHLGLLLADLRRAAQARRSLANAVRLAAALPAGAVLPEGDGLTAGGLRAAAAVRLGQIGAGEGAGA